jgi:hypothetical protein
MLRKLAALALVALFISGVGVAGEKPWMDMANCAMCKNMVAVPGLMENMTFEQYDLTKGVVSVTTVDKAHLAAYRKAHGQMMETAKKLQAGEMMELCGHCTALGAIMMKGVDQDYAETPTGDIWVMTSSKPEVATELKAWAKRNKEEMAKMHAGHEG